MAVFCLWVLFAEKETYGQAMAENDTTYYLTYPGMMVGRIYFSRKFTGFNAEFKELPGTVFKYEPNTTRNLGIGGTYKSFTLNLALGFGFLNPDRGYGETRYLDLQSHLYLDKYNIDLFGQFYRGYYLENYPDEDGGAYVRPDIHLNEVGISVQRVQNHRKFSFRAAFQNTDYQKRSAGTWLYGWDIYYGVMKADSSIAPEHIAPVLPEYERLNYFKTGPSGGYAYTLVIRQHFYITGAVKFGLNAGTYRLDGPDTSDKKFFMSIDGGYRLALGYNSRHVNAGGLFVLQRVHYNESYNNITYTGNVRLIFAYRFSVAK